MIVSCVLYSSGVEVLLKNQAPHLLDIDGDSCHHIHNVAKSLCEPFGFWLERLFADLHMDFKYCTEYKKIMSEICRIAGVNFTAPQRFIAHRWLNAYDQAIETSRLFDLYIIFYSAFLPVHIKGQYHKLVSSLIQKFETHASRERVRGLLSLLATKKPVTAKGRQRKDRILDHLFIEKKRTLLQLGFYQASMLKLKQFVLKFQKKEPLIHQLHDEQLSLVRNFLIKFIEAKFIRGLDAVALKSLSLTDDHINCNEDEIFIGCEARECLKNSRLSVSSAFMACVKKGYLQAGKVLLRKLPLSNATLRALSFLNPDKRSKSESISQLQYLSSLFNHLLTSDEKSAVQEEILEYVVNDIFPELGNNRVDLWWAAVNCVPILRKVMKAALSIFHGPQVESSFSIMKNVMDKKAGSMAVGTYSSVQTIKYHLKACKSSSVEFFKRPSVNHTPVSGELVNNMKSARRKYMSALDAKKQNINEELTAIQASTEKLQTAAQARRLKERAVQHANKVHRQRCLKKTSNSSHATSSLKRKLSPSVGSSPAQKKRKH